MADAVHSQNQNIFCIFHPMPGVPTESQLPIPSANQTDKQTSPASYLKHHPLNSYASGNQTTTAGNEQYLVSTVQTQISAHGIDLLQSWETSDNICLKLPDQELTLLLLSRDCKSASAELTLAHGR